MSHPELKTDLEPTIQDRFKQFFIPEMESRHNSQGISMAGPASLGAWLKEHRLDVYAIRDFAQEQFKTPIPYPDIVRWRAEAGYDYGDSWPTKLFWSLMFADEERTPHSIIEGSDTLIRLRLLLPHRENKKIKAALPLAVHFTLGSDPNNHIGRDGKIGKIDWPELGFNVGSKQLSKEGVKLDTRASQELLIVATRILLGKTTQYDQGKKPMRRLLRPRGFLPTSTS